MHVHMIGPGFLMSYYLVLLMFTSGVTVVGGADARFSVLDSVSCWR